MRIRPVAGVALVIAGGLAAAAAHGPSAQADVSTGEVQANVAVSSAITLTLHTASFTLAGPPNTTVAQPGAVTYTVISNNATGYEVLVRSTSDVLTPVTAGNPDTIPIGNLEVRAISIYRPLSTTDTVIANTDTPSGPTGDDYSNDYRVHIPNVRADTYHTTLVYTAVTNP
ncbi:hypothetical protein ACFSL4_11340 [Streptomyces caeni]|uniref:Uncharacterized protein n=1 Tax=Streptomyces caeni TaxID=2307231 RepID=A0ABW4IPA1_9ACTN